MDGAAVIQGIRGSDLHFNPRQIMMGRGGLRKESGGSTQNLELNFKLLDSLKVIPAGMLPPQTEWG